MSYVLCTAHIGLLLSEKELFLEFFGGLKPESGDVERKRYFLELYVYFLTILFWLFNFVVPLCHFEDIIFFIKKISTKFTIFIKVH